MKRREFLKFAPLPFVFPWLVRPAASNAAHPPLNSEKRVMDWIEREIGVAPGVGDRAICKKTGTPYVEIVWDAEGLLWLDCGDPNNSSARSVAKFDSEAMAWTTWAAGLNQYRQGRTGSLHWRIKPEAHFVEPSKHVDVFGDETIEEGDWWYVYGRLVIDPVRAL